MWNTRKKYLSIDWNYYSHLFFASDCVRNFVIKRIFRETVSFNEGIITKSLQRSDYSKAVTTKTLQIDVAFSFPQLFPIRFSWKLKHCSFSSVRFQHIRAINTIITHFWSVTRMLPSVITPTSKAQLVLGHQAIFPSTDWKSS